MIQDLTEKEIKWRFSMLLEDFEDTFESKALSASKEVGSEFAYNAYTELTLGSIVYLCHIGGIKIILHGREKCEAALYTVTRKAFEKNLWNEPSEMQEYDRPSNRKIEVPNLFLDEGNEKFTHISICVDYPDSKIGDLCHKMLDYLQPWCKKPVHLISWVVFIQAYYNDRDLYISAIHRCLETALMYDHWHSNTQLPSDVAETLALFIGDDVHNVYDPFMAKDYLFLFSGGGTYHAQTTSAFHMYATMLYAGIYGHDTEHIEIADATEKWIPGDSDCILITPELGKTYKDPLGKEEPIGVWAMQQIKSSFESLKAKAIMLLPSSCLTSKGHYEILRDILTTRNLLDCVILLPAGIMPNTGISTAIVVLNSNREDNEPILFADFTSLTREQSDCDDEEKPELDYQLVLETLKSDDERYICYTNAKEIESFDFEWYTPKYVHHETDVPNGYRRVKIREIMEYFEEFDFGPSFSNTILSDEDFAQTPFDYDRAGVSMDMKEFIAKKDQDGYTFISQSCFVVNPQDGLKTYFKEMHAISIEKLVLPTYCEPYRINTDMIDVNYLRLLLHNLFNEASQAHPELSKGHEIWGIVYKSEVTIPLALEEQRHIYDEAKLNYAVEKARQEGLDEAINRMKQEYMMEVRMRKHDMKPLLSQLSNLAKNISFYLNKIDGNADTVEILRQKIGKISTYVSDLRMHMERLTEEDIYGEPELVNPISLLREFCGTTANYSVEIEVDEMSLKEAGIELPIIKISPVDFSTLANTIIDNAVTHAFLDSKENYKLRILFSFDKTKDAYIIDFQNDGDLMPEGMNKLRYGLKGDKGVQSQGTGLGGFRVKSITGHYGGDYDVFCNRLQKHTTIRVVLPKYSENEEI